MECLGCPNRQHAEKEPISKEAYGHFMLVETIKCLNLMRAIFRPEKDHYQHRSREKKIEPDGSLASVAWMG